MTHRDYAALVNAALEAALPEPTDAAPVAGEIPQRLAQAMRYSLLQGGKRLRPSMLLAAVDMLGGDLDEAMPYACATEMIHCYSLIHDDLPGMDDDVLRRGLPTNHVVFGVGAAILAGDGLLSLAFETMAQAALARPERALRHVRALAEIARGCGVRGMVAGQSLDLQLEYQPGATLRDLHFIQVGKTAALFAYPLRAAAHLCSASGAQIDALTRYGLAFGQLFQTVDDLLDEVGDEAQMGKQVGKDRENGKLTAVSLFGLGGAEALRASFLDDGRRALDGFGPEADHFRALIEKTASRTA